MTQSFDEWFKENGSKYDYVLPAARDSYEAGAQSRQAEVDELKATIVKYEAGLRKNKANKHKLLAKNIELQARVDGALKILDGMRHNGAYRAIDILKGNKDEHN